MISCCSKQFFRNLSNISLYAHIHINQRSNMSLVDTILQVSTQPKFTWIKVRRSCRPRIWKTPGDNTFVSEGFTKQTLNMAIDMWWCSILHKNTGLNTVTFLQSRNHTLYKYVFVTCRRHSTPDRSTENGPRIKVLVKPHHRSRTQNVMAVDTLQAV